MYELSHEFSNDLRILGNQRISRKSFEMLKFDEEHSAGHEKAKFLHFSVNNRKISAVKHFTEKPILLNFVNLSILLLYSNSV